MKHKKKRRNKRRKYIKRIESILCVVLVVLVVILVTMFRKNPLKQGLEYLETGDYQSAVEQFEEAAEKEKSAGEAYRGIGIARWEVEDYEGACEAFEKALDAGAKKTGTIYNFLGSCEMKLGDPEKALNAYNLALEDENNSEEMEQEIRYNIIAAYEQMKDWDSAKQKLKEYLDDYPDDEEAKKEAEFLETR